MFWLTTRPSVWEHTIQKPLASAIFPACSGLTPLHHPVSVLAKASFRFLRRCMSWGVIIPPSVLCSQPLLHRHSCSYSLRPPLPFDTPTVIQQLSRALPSDINTLTHTHTHTHHDTSTACTVPSHPPSLRNNPQLCFLTPIQSRTCSEASGRCYRSSLPAEPYFTASSPFKTY